MLVGEAENVGRHFNSFINLIESVCSIVLLVVSVFDYFFSIQTSHAANTFRDKSEIKFVTSENYTFGKT